jgi:TPR repeat protein
MSLHLSHNPDKDNDIMRVRTEIIIALVSAIVAGGFGLVSVWYEHYLENSEQPKSAVTEVSQQNREAPHQAISRQSREVSQQNQEDNNDNEVENQKLFQQLKRRANRGEVKAQLELADMYTKGKGIEQDMIQAIKWYRKAASKGEVKAQLELANMYAKGKDVVQNLPKAIKWYRKAANKDNTMAQFRLGQMYEKGKGVEKDLVQAEKWYRKAANKGHKKAKKKLEKQQNSQQET